MILNIKTCRTPFKFTFVGYRYLTINIRRTCIPTLAPGPDNFNYDQYPSRYLYPESEQVVNKENYEPAVSCIGGDNINIKSWWEM